MRDPDHFLATNREAVATAVALLRILWTAVEFAEPAYASWLSQ